MMTNVRALVQRSIKDGSMTITPLGMSHTISEDDYIAVVGEDKVGLVDIPPAKFMELMSKKAC